MRYDLIRLILLDREQIDLLGRDLTKADSAGMPRREWWLREIFGEQIAFQHYGSDFHYVPEPRFPGLIVGRIRRPFHLTENLPPDAGLGEIERDGWIAAPVIIDATSHPNGQKIAMQADSRVGKPAGVLESLATHINARVPPEPFIRETNPIVDSETFWTFERENRNEITSIVFEFVAPNMFGTRHDLDKELKELRDHEKIQKAKLELESKDGLNLETDRVRTSVSYTFEGGGSLRARTKKGKLFNSKNKIKRVVVPDLNGDDGSNEG
jgi:hypothetical protein